MARASIPGPDLFDAAAAEEARLQVEAAELARARAARGAKLAPIGETTVRRRRFMEATAAALAAEILAQKAARG